MPIEQQSPLLHLPAELRNSIYEFVAYTTKVASIPTQGTVLTAPSPLSQVCRQLRAEYTPLLKAIPLDYASTITLHNMDFNVSSLILSLQRILPAAPAVKRTLIFRVHLTSTLTSQDIQIFTKHFSEPDVPPSTAAITRYKIILDPAGVDLNQHRLAFARLAKQYRFHRSDGEQRVWEKVYWSFAEAAEKIDAVTVRQFAMGCWRRDGAAMCFI